MAHLACYRLTRYGFEKYGILSIVFPIIETGIPRLQILYTQCKDFATTFWERN